MSFVPILYRTTSSYGDPELFKRDIASIDMAKEVLSNPEKSPSRVKAVCNLMSKRKLNDPHMLENLKIAFAEGKAEEEKAVAEEDGKRLKILLEANSLPVDVLKIANQFSSRFVK